ncbi:MAG: hypothetical protein WCD54_08295, partial [Pseudolabrys sp.]
TMLNPMQIFGLAPWQVCPLWVIADMAASQSDVRFTPESGHVQCNSACPLCANSGHRAWGRLKMK